MTITDVKAIYPRWQHFPPGGWQSYFWQIVVRIETDHGVTGYGYGGGGEPGVLIVNRHFRDLLIGRTVHSTDSIREIWDVLYRASLPYGRGGIALMALSGVDLALWDLLGKAERTPVHRLIGEQTKNRIRAYTTGQDFAWARDAGYTAVKFNSRWQDASAYDEAVSMASAVRMLFGRDTLLMVDCYMSWTAEVTVRMRELLGSYRIYWFEDVLTPDHLTELAALKARVRPVLLAGGEHDMSPYRFEDIARAGALDLWQPDITWCGGMSAGLRIVDLARRYGIPVVPHRGGEVWGLHLIAATDCMDLAEAHTQRFGEIHDALWLDEPSVVDGYLAPLETPGFGVRLNESMV